MKTQTQVKEQVLWHAFAIAICVILYCMLFTSQAQASTAYRTWEGERINGYKISVEYEDSMQYLISSKKGQETVVLDEGYFHSFGEGIDGGTYINNIVSNGKTVFYSVTDFDNNGLTTIYKISVTGKNRSVVKTVKKGYYLKLVTLYNNKLYYSHYDYDKSYYRTYEYNLKTGKTKRIFKGEYVGESGYGSTIIMSEPQGNGMENRKCFAYNVKTKKMYSLPSSMLKHVESDGIYYTRYTSKGSIDYKCSLKGTNIKKLS